MNLKTAYVIAFLILGSVSNAQKRLEITDLPKPAATFIQNYFKGISVDRIKRDKENGDKGYEVVLGDGTEIEFRSDGSYREIDGGKNAIPTAFIDSKITVYTAKNYPNQKITHIDYGRTDVEIELSGKTELVFSKDGKFLKVD